MSAFTHYRLYLNGIEIGWGPNPANPAWYYYDSYEVTSHLRRGDNIIAALAYNHGYHVPVDTVIADNVGGAFIFQAEMRARRGGTQSVMSGESWKAQRSPAWDTASPQYVELRHGFKEYVDGRKGVLDFVKYSYDDSHWQRADVLGNCSMGPFKRLLPREIKHFRSFEVLPQQATSVGYNYAYGFGPERGWEVDDPLSLVGGYPKGTHLKLLFGGEGGDLRDMRKKNLAQGECSVRMIRRDEPPSILVDFGRLCAGRFRLEIADAPTGSRIDIAYGESLNLTYIDRYICRKGAQVFSPYHRRVARHALLTFQNLRHPLVVSKVAFDFIEYPVKNRGFFECSDERLTRIWRTARRTVHLSMQDHFEDSIWREQKLFAGDMQVQALAAYYAFGETQYVRKCLRQLARIPRSSGWIAHAGPSVCPDEYTIIDFPARYIMSLRDYVLASGDVALAEELYPFVERQIREYASMKHARGLLDVGCKGGFSRWCFLNWGEIHKQGVVAGLNFLFVQALEAAAQLAVYLGKHTDAGSCRARAKLYRCRLNAELWDGRQGLYADCIARGARSPHASVETNTLALLAGSVPGRRRASLIKKLVSSKTPWVTKTPFFNCFVVEALFQNRQPRKALDTMRWYWGEMIDRGADTFWEAFDYETPPGSLPHKQWSLCHGWSAGPVYLVGAYLLGVRPSGPGFRSIRLQPRPLDMEWAAGAVPTPRGDIHVEWEKSSRTVKIRVPKKIETRLCLDDCRNMKEVFLNGRQYRGRHT